MLRPTRRRLLALYLSALVLSYLVWWRRGPAPLPPDVSSAEVVVFDGDEPTSERMRLVWREQGDRGAPVILLLHGSPGAGSNFDRLLPLLSQGARVLAPDLPGFGLSAAALPDYSIRAQAHELLAWLEGQGIERVHILGYSLGGGVALEMAAADPNRVASLVLLSSIGVQELEWFGDYRLNHAVHGAQLALWQLARWLLPHFGGADALRGYVRGFFDTDQRRLRPILERWQGPMLIVHGERDFLVPPAAAREHARIVPQAELVMVEGKSHFMPWTWSEPLARLVLDFVARVEAGRAATRAEASGERLALAERPFDPADAPPFAGMVLAAVMVMLAAATLVSEDLTCFSAGLLVSQGRIGFLWASLACFIGIFIGDVGLYLLGRLLGRTALGRAPLRWIVSEERVERARRWFESRGPLVIFLSRFMPGLRLPTYVAAGVVRTSLVTFSLWFMLAGLLWTPMLVGLAAWLGTRAEALFERFGGMGPWSILLLLVLLVLLKRLVVPLFTWRGRRLLWGRIQRLWRWEFWPPWLFYLPVVGWIAALALRYRSLALVTAADPAIPTGGFVGESKSAILEGLGAQDPRVAPFLLLRAGEAQRVERARAFVERHGLPLVLKPDVGQRGSGVRVLREAEALERAVEQLSVDSLLQLFIPGPEFGVFYARMPGEDRGRLLSITEKVIPRVSGDGRRTLEELILSDARAVCQARVYLETNASRLEWVPAAGETVELVDLGTHARGAIFLDGSRYASEALLEEIDDLSRGFEGFYFGRYDLRVPSAEALTRGEHLRVIELNGVTSECTHIYDPRQGLLRAWITLCRQWSLAYAIAAANVRAGARPTGALSVLRLYLAYRRTQRSHAPTVRE